MTGVADRGLPELTPEQSAVVNQAVSAKVLLTAGAGTGKTYTLVRRLDRLVSEGDVSVGEILVLTFARATAREIGTRLAAQGNAARRMRARTFDSWALELLDRFDAATEWRTRSFDSRITAATDLISRGGADEIYEHELLHVVIDEAQDLVGGRRELVESLLDRYDCGFTVVGDIAQAIYGWQAADPAERKGEAGRFVRWLGVTFGAELIELELTRNFRARTDEAATALASGSKLRDLTSESAAEAAFAELLKELRSDLLDRMDLGDFGAGYVQDALRDFDGTTAILCRTNGQALLVSEQLHEGQVPHRVQGSVRDRFVPAWFARLFPVDAAPVVSREEFDAAWQAERGDQRPGAVRADAIWRQLLKYAGASSHRVLDRSKLRACISTGRLPDELTAAPSAALTVSSVHRAKGLEFDRVIVVTPSVETTRDADVAEEVRTLYVAMTRPRDELMRAGSLDTRSVRLAELAERWGRYGWRKYQRFGMEVRGGDVDTTMPPGTTGFHADPAALQRYMSENLGIGDEVRLERCDDRSGSSTEPPAYIVFHGDRPVGSASDRFRADLELYLKRWRKSEVSSWPRTIAKVWVEAVETVAGSGASGRRAGLGDYGVWLVPRLNGLSRFTYDSKGGDNDEA